MHERDRDASRGVALIGGATTPRGQALTKALDRAGWRLVLCPTKRDDEDLQSLRELVREVLRQEGRAIGLDEPLSTKKASDEAIARAVETFGKLDALVTCSPFARPRSIARVDEPRWRELLDSHLTSTYVPTRAVVRWMCDHEHEGRIVCLTGTAGTTASEFGQSHLAAVMCGVCGVVRALAHELRHRRITVNAVAAAVADETAAETKDPALPERAAQLGCFLLSSAASEVTGQVITVKGRHVSTMRQVGSAGAVLEDGDWEPELISRLWSQISK